MKYKLVIFDLDGTILNTLEDLTDSLNFALSCSGYPNHSIDAVRSFVGNGIKNLIKKAMPKEKTETEIQNVHKVFTDYYKIHCANKTAPYPGIIDIIKKLRKVNIKTAVISNKADYAVQNLCKKYFDGMFDYAAGERESIAKKPAPDAVFEVLHKLNINKTDTVIIGDSEVDILTAKNAGVDCIAVAWGFRDVNVLKEYGANIIIKTPKELLNIL